MKKLFLLLGIFVLVSCMSTQSATYYHFIPQNNRSVEDVGNITYIVEKRGYSIVTVQNQIQPIYISGKLSEIKKPYNETAYIWTQKQGKKYVQHLVYERKRYSIDKNPS